MTNINKKCLHHTTFQHHHELRSSWEKICEWSFVLKKQNLWICSLLTVRGHLSQQYRTNEKLLFNVSQGCTSSGHQVAWATNFCMVAAYICGSSVWNLLYVTLLMPWILRWLLEFFKNLYNSDISWSFVFFGTNGVAFWTEWWAFLAFNFAFHDSIYNCKCCSWIPELWWHIFKTYLSTWRYMMTSLQILVWQHPSTFCSSCSYFLDQLLC
jgi:hypothetical protein